MSEPDTTDFGEAAQDEVTRARLLESVKDDERRAALRELLKNEPVRDLLWRIIEHCNVYQAVYQRNFGDMALQEGTRQVGLWLLKEICEADASAEMRMRQKAVAIAHALRAQEREVSARRQRRT